MVSFGSGIHHPRRLYSSVRPHRGGFMPLVGPLIGAVAPYLLETLVRKITGSGRRRTTRRVHRHRIGVYIERDHIVSLGREDHEGSIVIAELHPVMVCAV